MSLANESTDQDESKVDSDTKDTDGDSVNDDTKVLIKIEEDLVKAKAIITSCADVLVNALDWRTDDQRRLRRSVMKKLLTIGKHIGLIIRDVSNGKPSVRKTKRRDICSKLKFTNSNEDHEELEPLESKVEVLDIKSEIKVEAGEALTDDLSAITTNPEVIVKCEPELHLGQTDRLKTENQHVSSNLNCNTTEFIDENQDFLEQDQDELVHELGDIVDEQHEHFNEQHDAIKGDHESSDIFNCDNSKQTKQKSNSKSKKKGKKLERVAKLLSCEDCGKMISAQNFVRHKKSVHTPIRCEVCGEMFPGTKLLIQHRHDTHDAEKRFVHMCDMCGYRTDVEKHLRRHREAKHEAWKYHCEWCSKVFSSAETLKQHIRIHTGERPYACKICGKAFKQGTQLSRHKITHTDLKPFECNVCGKTFNQKGNMKTHMKNHIKSE